MPDFDRVHRNQRLALTVLVYSHHSELVLLTLVQVSRLRLATLEQTRHLRPPVAALRTLLHQVPLDRCPAVIGRWLPRERD